MFRLLSGHHQAFLRIKFVNAAYMDMYMYAAFTNLILKKA